MTMQSPPSPTVTDDSPERGDETTIYDDNNSWYSITRNGQGAIEVQFQDPTAGWEQAPDVVDDVVPDTTTYVLLVFCNNLGANDLTVGVELALDQTPTTLIASTSTQPPTLTWSSSLTLTPASLGQSITLTGPCTIDGIDGTYTLSVDGTVVTAPSFPLSASQEVVVTPTGQTAPTVALAAASQPVTLVCASYTYLSTPSGATATLWLSPRSTGPWQYMAQLQLTPPAVGGTTSVPFEIVDTDGNVIYDDPTFKVQTTRGVGFK